MLHSTLRRLPRMAEGFRNCRAPGSQRRNRATLPRKALAVALAVAFAVNSACWTGPLRHVTESSQRSRRRDVILVSVAATSLLAAGPAGAYVKGAEPPEEYGLLKGWKKKRTCTNKIDCLEISSEKAEAEFGYAKDIAFKQTSSGVRYKDLDEGSSEQGVAASGQRVDVKYKVMRSGKRSNDGLSGEASTIFSWGYGEEDGEPPKAVLTATLGEGRLVKALDEGLVGMAVGGKRRVQVRPEGGLGWMKFGKCAEKVDAVGVAVGLPGAGAANQEACIDKTLLPQPASFSAERRFSRRFDESLIVEVELVGLKQK